MEREIIFFNLEAEIKRAKITKSNLAAMVGISRGTLSAKTTGKTEFSLAEMELIRAKLEKLTGSHYTIDFLFRRGN